MVCPPALQMRKPQPQLQQPVGLYIPRLPTEPTLRASSFTLQAEG